LPRHSQTNLGGTPLEQGALAKILVLRNDREVIGGGVIPDFLVRVAGQAEVTICTLSGKLAATIAAVWARGFRSNSSFMQPP